MSRKFAVRVSVVAIVSCILLQAARPVAGSGKGPEPAASAKSGRPAPARPLRRIDVRRLSGPAAAPVALAASDYGPTDHPAENECLVPRPPDPVDDSDPGFAKYQHDDVPGDLFWWDETDTRCDGTGYSGGGMTWTFERGARGVCTPPLLTEDVNWGIWTPPLSCPGTYQVSARIPGCGGSSQVQDAIYRLYTSDSGVPAALEEVNQFDHAGGSAPLFSHHLNADGGDYVRLGDVTVSTPSTSPPCGTMHDDRVAFDEVSFQYLGLTRGSVEQCALEHQLGNQACQDPTRDPVIPSIGNFLHQVEDVRISFRGPVNLELERTYNSRNRRVGLFGLGWSSVLDMQVRVFADGSADVWFPDGQSRSWSAGGGGYVAFPGVFDALVRTASGWEMTTPAQITYFFDDIYEGGDGEGYSGGYVGRLRRIEDRHDNGVTFAYDPGGMPATATDDSGRQLVFTDVAFHITEMRDPLGRTWQYGYDEDLLTATTDPRDGVTLYTHDGNGFIATIRDPEEIIFIRNLYDADGRVVEQRDAAGSPSTFVYGPTSTTMTDPLARATVYSHDAQLRRSSRLDAMGFTQSWDHPANTTLARYTDRRNNSWQQLHDTRGNVTHSECPTGCATDLTYNATNDLLSIKNALEHETTFTWVGGNLTEIHFPDGGDVLNTYDSFGQIFTRTDQNAHVTRFVHDVHGDRTLLTDPLDHSTTQEFDIVGRRKAIIDANGHRTEFEYDGNDNVVEVKDPKGARIVMEYDRNDMLVKLTDRREAAWTFEYDDHLRLVREVDPEEHVTQHQYDIVQRRRTTIDGRLQPTAFRYDDLDRLIEIEDARGGVTVLTLDPNGNVAVSRDPEGHETKTSYDPRNLPILVTDAMEGERELEYDALGRLIRSEDQRDAETKYTYDPMDRLKTIKDHLDNETLRTYDLVGNLRTERNARGALTQLAYDDADRLRSETDPMGHVSSVERDPVGNIILHRNARNFATTLEYDPNDNLRRVVDALDGVLRFEHDDEDARTAVIDQRGHRTEFGYDRDGLLRTVTEPGGLETLLGYDEEHDLVSVRNAKGKVTESRRDELGRVILVIDPLGNETELGYDRDGLLTSRKDANEHLTRFGHDPLHRLTRVTDALTAETAYGYDPTGNLTSILDANLHATEFEHDILGRLIREENAEGGTWRYVHDAVGNVVQMTDANGRATRYVYDLDDLLVRKEFARDPPTRFFYDENHSLVEVRDGLGRMTQGFDALDRLIRSRNHAGQEVQYGYDAESHRTSFRFPDARSMQYVIDANDRVQQVTDPEGGIYRATYDAIHQMTSLSSPNATVAALVYDDADRLTSLSNRRTSGGLLSSFSFTLDGVGNRVQTHASHIDQAGVVQTDYTYDAVDRLVRSDSADRFTDYGYDPVGNRIRLDSNYDPHRTPTSVDPYFVTYAHDDADRLLTALHSVLGQTTYQNDANGNRTRQEGPGEFSGAGGQQIRRDYRFDDENRMSRVDDSQRQSSSWSPRGTTYLSYDGLGRLFRRETDERVGGGGRKWSDFAYDGLDPVVETIRPGSKSMTYHRGFGGLLSSREFPGRGAGLTAYYHRDGLGSTSVMTNHQGQSAHVYRYTDFGTIVDVNGGAADASAYTNPHNTFCYTGQEFAQGLRLHHFYAREYDAVAGVWLQADEARGRVAQPHTLHRFQFVGGNPIRFVDEYGFERSPPDASIPLLPDIREWSLEKLNAAIQRQIQKAPRIAWRPSEPEYEPYSLRTNRRPVPAPVTAAFRAVGSGICGTVVGPIMGIVREAANQVGGTVIGGLRLADALIEDPKAVLKAAPGVIADAAATAFTDDIVRNYEETLDLAGSMGDVERNAYLAGDLFGSSLLSLPTLNDLASALAKGSAKDAFIEVAEETGEGILAGESEFWLSPQVPTICDSP